MDVPRATSALAGTRFSRIEWVDETGSTNADLLAAAREGAPEQVLGAEFQTAGRGRLGRAWESGAGASILCSVLVRPRSAVAPIDDPHVVTTALGLAAAEAVEEVTGRRVGVKWPNDLVAGTAEAPDDRKLAGILAESVIVDGRVDAVVAGIGINVNWPDELPPELAGTATSVSGLVGAPVDRTDLVIAMLRHLDARLAAPGDVRDAVAARSATLGRTVRVERSAGDLVGVAVGLTPGGHLLVEADGVTHDVSVGDVIHLRPTD
ncbi:MAG: biotin--[acetyl-CoA-carboxylase] ligase [Acidimicrobiales bacterium]